MTDAEKGDGETNECKINQYLHFDAPHNMMDEVNNKGEWLAAHTGWQTQAQHTHSTDFPTAYAPTRSSFW